MQHPLSNSLRNSHKLKPFISAVSILIIFNTLVYAEQKLPDGWREPFKTEITDNIFTKRSEAPYGYLAVKADFNGDGIMDTAQLLVNDTENKMGLFVFLSNQGKFESVLLDELNDKSWVDAMGLSIVKAGKYKTACGKGYWKCKEGTPEELVLKHPALNYFKFQSANSFFVWDAVSESFTRIWMSD